MHFQRFYDVKLAQASYLIGCQATGEAIVVDPNRDVDQYVDAAAAQGFRVTHVTETHIHADFVSGARELAARTGAQLLLSGEGGPEWRYAYAGESHARLLRDGDTFRVGNIELEVMHTPGHTPEHLSFLVTDGAAIAGPWGILTGDFVFVGDVGRPDLLERAAGYAGTMEAAARTLHRALQRFRTLPDHLQVWPGHGAGSACGKALGAMPSSTVGYEKRANWGLADLDEATFVGLVLEGQPEPPRYFAEMKRINRDGPRVLGGLPRPVHLPAHALAPLVSAEEIVVDTRSAAQYAAEHVPGTLNIPLDGSFTTWAGWLLPYDRDIHLLVDSAACAHCVDAAVRDLAMIGLDRVRGVLGAESIAEWGRMAPLTTVRQTTPREAAESIGRGEAVLVDVRGRAEWEAAHPAGATNIPLGHLVDRRDELPRHRSIIVQCGTGARSAIAASVLERLGITRVANLVGGMAAWERAGLDVEGPDARRAGAPALAVA
ncbi:MAG TPA: MBL fold metallo-hydrolase [Gemmatimonadaceae bacterium]|jgi:hydroxyacylglutathione hydrolase|nr:MBL fold metallo-hydrolase [Gemmatimonadaceae bacterium]